MGDMREFFEPYKEMHKQRVAQNPQRLEYAIKLLKENGITFKVCNKEIAQINCYFANGKCLTFYEYFVFFWWIGRKWYVVLRKKGA